MDEPGPSPGRGHVDGSRQLCRLGESGGHQCPGGWLPILQWSLLPPCWPAVPVLSGVALLLRKTVPAAAPVWGLGAGP